MLLGGAHFLALRPMPCVARVRLHRSESSSPVSVVLKLPLLPCVSQQPVAMKWPGAGDVTSPPAFFPSEGQEAWQKGVLFAAGQNLARQLMETPANEMTPTRFAEIIEKKLRGASAKTEVHIR